MFQTNVEGDVVVARIIAFVVAITIHEFAHAWSAYQLGDSTAARMGRITLNPVSHFDPIGFIGMLFIALGFPAFGWGRPVPVNPNYLRGGHRGMAIVALAGPLSNVIVAMALMLPIRFGAAQPTGDLEMFISQMVFINLILAAFNLIPIPPLDGLKILTGILPAFWYRYLAPLEMYGFYILFGLIMFGRLIGGGEIIVDMYAPAYNLLTRAIVGSGFG